MKPRRRLFGFGAAGRQALMFAMALTVAYPIYYMIATSLKTRHAWTLDQFGIPFQPTIENYVAVFNDSRLPVWFANSALVTAGSVAISTLVATLGSYALARLRFRWKRPVLWLMVVLMMVPPAVLVVPLFVMLQPLGLTNSHPGLILIYAGMLVPFSVFMLTSFFRGLPGEIFEAARIDGASTIRTLWSIVVPLSTPGLMTMVIVNTLWVWNELLIALVFIQDDSKRTLMPGLTQFKGHFSVNEPLVMAATFLAALPMLALFLFGQRYFVRGLVAGALK